MLYCLVSVDISAVLSFPVHELEISFHLLMYSLVSFTDTYSFKYTNLFLFVYIYSKYFIMINTIVNGIALLISFSDCLLLVYTNTTDFDILI